MTHSTITSKGQITIPVDVRNRLGIGPGDRVEFVEISEGVFAIYPSVDDVRSLKGFLKSSRVVTTEEMRSAIRKRGSKS